MNVARKLVASSPTPQDRRAVIFVIKARTNGELVLYVNDAVLMVHGWTDLFSDNAGTGKVTVERITEASFAAK